jgi:hypothetical protein
MSLISFFGHARVLFTLFAVFLFVFLRLVAGFSRLSISDLIENEQGLGD